MAFSWSLYSQYFWAEEFVKNLCEML